MDEREVERLKRGIFENSRAYRDGFTAALSTLLTNVVKEGPTIRRENLLELTAQMTTEMNRAADFFCKMIDPVFGRPENEKDKTK